MGKFPGDEEVAECPNDSAINISTTGVNAVDCNASDAGCCDGKSNSVTFPYPKTKSKEDLICLADNKIPKSRKIRDLAPSSNNPQQPSLTALPIFKKKKKLHYQKKTKKSGKKNTRLYQVKDAPSPVSYGWRLRQADKTRDLIDEAVRSTFNVSEFMKCVHVGLLCVQEDPNERPTMADVVLMLGT
ncbi:hypothetical protein V6N11_072350 [Hibiscus sabdariffa]|uniref:Uncharacterized protein n=1 Tax=Hibiscus sabdariffa TaxID=183260 RepID=A0ABR2U2S6_9ROSI